MNTLLKDQYRGFSLIEILVTLAITAIIFQGLSQLTGGMLLGWSRSASSLENQSSGFTTVDRMAEELNALLPVSVLSNGAPVAAFAGTQDYLEFARHAVGFETRRDLNRVVYRIERSQIGVAVVRQSGALSSSDPFAEQVQARTVLAELRGEVRFDYSMDGAAFVPTWINQPVPPGFIRITLSLESRPGSIFTKIASPTIDATSECLLPAYRVFCDYQLSLR